MAKIGMVVGGGLFFVFCCMSLIIMAIKRKTKRGGESNALHKSKSEKTNEAKKPGITWKKNIKKSKICVLTFYSIHYANDLKYIPFVADKDSSFNLDRKTRDDPEGEENEFGVFENPYYEDGDDMRSNPVQTTTKNVDLNEVEHVKSTTNVYYEMWAYLRTQTYYSLW